MKTIVNDILIDFQNSKICIGDASNKLYSLLNNNMKTNEFLIKLEELIFQYSKENELNLLDIDLNPKFVEYENGKKSFIYYEIILKTEGK